MRYPSLLRRVLATQIDVFVILFLLYLFAHSPFYNGEVETYWPLWLFILYEPVCTRYLCTLGQFLLRFRVRTFSDHSKVPLWRGLVRVLVKYLLGILSFLLMPRQPQRRAFHDLIAGTIVLEAVDVAEHDRLTIVGGGREA